MRIKTLLELASESLFPSDVVCVLCGEEVPKENRYGICKGCNVPLNSKYCVLCGSPLTGDLGEYCEFCKTRHPIFECARAPLEYKDGVKNAIRRFKYFNMRYLRRFLCEFMLDSIVAEGWDIDAITFVPLHPLRQKQRGYNQARLLADYIASELSIPLLDALAKTKHTINQAMRNFEQRQSAIKDTIACSGGVEDKNILLVDDVKTTGATADECAKVLKRAGALDVYVITAAAVRKRPVLI